ncbi:unnamed protein product [Mytilus coruscus]|uniref:Uncharacterized protein n=1 Tax=Mytilus coruscus TaxID=42192 RepID=A0A6J8C3S5_MYTCO|nr:unnamed protein product [Mytilus coruscus]
MDYPYCNAIGLPIESLLQLEDSADHTSIGSFELSNGVSKIHRLCELKKKLNSKKKVPGYKNISDLLSKSFEPPVKQVPTFSITANGLEHEQEESPANSSRFEPELTCNTSVQTETFDSDDETVQSKNLLQYYSLKLKKKNERLQREISVKQEKLKTQQDKIGYFSIRNINKRQEKARQTAKLLRASKSVIKKQKRLLHKAENKHTFHQSYTTNLPFTNHTLPTYLPPIIHYQHTFHQSHTTNIPSTNHTLLKHLPPTIKNNQTFNQSYTTDIPALSHTTNTPSTNHTLPTYLPPIIYYHQTFTNFTIPPNTSNQSYITNIPSTNHTNTPSTNNNQHTFHQSYTTNTPSTNHTLPTYLPPIIHYQHTFHQSYTPPINIPSTNQTLPTNLPPIKHYQHTFHQSYQHLPPTCNIPSTNHTLPPKPSPIFHQSYHQVIQPIIHYQHTFHLIIHFNIPTYLHQPITNHRIPTYLPPIIHYQHTFHQSYTTNTPSTNHTLPTHLPSIIHYQHTFHQSYTTNTPSINDTLPTYFSPIIQFQHTFHQL